MSLRRGLAALAVTAGAIAALACGGPEAGHTNVLLVTVDTLRPDRLSAYGYTGQQTPHIDRLASEGALFENAFTDTPWTTPSMASVLTGTYPTVHGFKSSHAHRLAAESVTLAEVLGEHGYATAAVVGSFPLDAIYRLDQGFDHYDDEFTTPIWIFPDHEPEHLESEFRNTPYEQRMYLLAKAVNDSRRTDPEVTDAALAWLREERSEPFFLWVHYFGPHSKPDWTIPEAQRLRVQLEQYDPDVRTNDAEVGRLLDALDALGLADDTLVVFHADHGESMGEQSYLGHGFVLNDASMHIPLVLRLPGRIEAGLRVERMVRNVDIFPTVLEATGIDATATGAEATPSGRSLLPLVDDAPLRRLAARLSSGDGDDSAYMETYYPAHKGFAEPVTLADGTETRVGVVRRALRTPRWKYVETVPHPLLDVAEGEMPEVPRARREALRKRQLFDLSAPGGEDRDVLADHPDVADDLAARLERYTANERASLPREDVDEETRLRLESLGYGE